MSITNYERIPEIQNEIKLYEEIIKQLRCMIEKQQNEHATLETLNYEITDKVNYIINTLNKNIANKVIEELYKLLELYHVRLNREKAYLLDAIEHLHKKNQKLPFDGNCCSSFSS